MSELQTRLSVALGTAYRIERELGGGGMSRVFLAQEVALGRKVVVKVLPPEMAAGVNQDRFRREIQLAARLQHPHIVPLLSAGSADDLLWYVMPYIDGESLRVKLTREGELPVAETVRILREVADALAYAHESGVVHRDIKPDNVMLSRGHAMVTDFGVAKAVSEASGGQSITSMGVALGTPAYMSPEQATGDAHIDHRSDLYSLGALAYEMLAGRPPFSGGNPQAMLAAHVTQTPDPLSTHRPSVPPALEAMVMRCLEKRAADRWQSAAELVPHLDAVLTPSMGTQPTGAVTISSGTAAALRLAQPMRVAMLFAVASLVVLSLAWVLQQRLGLPGWVVPLAAVLLAIGLPIMLLTARHERERLRLKTTGQHVASPDGLAGRLLTWRGALAGGALALGGLAVGTGAFMTLRAMGVGPFATLMTAGVLGARDQIVLADFTNRTTDSTVGAAITEAFRIDLTRSPVVRLAEPRDVSATLQRMRRDPAGHLDAAIAADVAQRIGAKAVLSGEVVPLGSGYVLSARLVSAADSVTLLAERETAADAGQLIPAVERLSKRMREKVGESLRTIRAGAPLEEVTTSSLPALRAYSDGSRAMDEGRYKEAFDAMQQAVALDSNFGMAWRTIGVMLWNIQQNRPAMVDALTRAWRLRDRMPPLEAAHAEAFYDGVVRNDLPAQIADYQRLLVSWPNNVVAINNLAVLVGNAGQLSQSEALYRRALDLQPRSVTYAANLVQTLVQEDKFAPADSFLRQIARYNPTNATRMLLTAQTAREQGDFRTAQVTLDSLAGADAAGRFARAARERQRLFLLQGKFRDAVREADALDTLPLGERFRSGAQTELAEYEVFVLGRTDAGVRRAEQALAWEDRQKVDPADRSTPWVLGTFAEAGRADRARALAAAWEASVPKATRDDIGASAAIAAEQAFVAHDGRALLAAVREVVAKTRCLVCGEFDEGRAFELMHEPDSAAARYTTYVTEHSSDDEGRAIYLAPALRRLGEMYDARGDKTNALRYYGRFVDRWKNADPELQPVVKQVRARMAELSGEPVRTVKP